MQMMDGRTHAYVAPPTPPPSSDLTLTIFDGLQGPRTCRLSEFNKPLVTFGRVPGRDIVLSSNFVSRDHGAFVLQNGAWHVEDHRSMNGTLLNRMRVERHTIHDGDIINIFDASDNTQGVLIIVSNPGGTQWYQYALQPRTNVVVGRNKECGIHLSHVSVSKRHAMFSFDGNQCWVQDLGSTNGTYVNGRFLRGRAQLREKDVVTIADSKLIYCQGAISYCTQRSGIRLEAQHIVKSVTSKNKIICNDVSLTINPCEMVAIIGGSGAGKTTIMNCISGYSTPTQGRVFVNGMDLYQNYNQVKNIIGYVPQQDIVYDGLTVQSMLEYTAELRLPADTSPEERKHTIAQVLEMVDLTERKDTMIKSLSGGQKKRASIAVELLSDPKLFFLDEPASGLDPGTERNLMTTLKKMAAGGKTVIMVTHSTLNLKMFDKIVFMGKGGNLCFCGSYDEACRFFGVNDIVDVYNMITDQSEQWKQEYQSRQTKQDTYPTTQQNAPLDSRGSEHSAMSQFSVLSRRYLNLIVNDRTRLLLLLGLPPLLTLLISLVAKEDGAFKQFEMTQALLFSFACSSFFIGTLNSIQEVCKERDILRREYMTVLKLQSYIGSKVFVLAIVCAVQSLLSTIILFIRVKNIPSTGYALPMFLEMFITAFLVSWSASITGIFVSSLVKNADRAMTLAPILLMPQLLFAGVIFDLKGVTEAISWFACCRWGMEALGASADLTNMKLRLEMQYPQFKLGAPDKPFYEQEFSNVFGRWFILLVFVAVFAVASVFVLRRIKSERK